jgi:ABC-type multidrug transport system fused ATPase/permease subunit
LSTVVKADRIVVLEHGRLAQTGTYESLLKEEGPFAELARRQIA